MFTTSPVFSSCYNYAPYQLQMQCSGTFSSPVSALVCAVTTHLQPQQHHHCPQSPRHLEYRQTCAVWTSPWVQHQQLLLPYQQGQHQARVLPLHLLLLALLLTLLSPHQLVLLMLLPRQAA